jgi:prevent-host-death family protein
MLTMADTVNLYDAKTHLSELVERAAAGEEIVIAKAGQPKAMLVPLPSKKKKKRELGFWRGKVWISDDFDAPLPEEIQAAFEGRRPRKRR